MRPIFMAVTLASLVAPGQTAGHATESRKPWITLERGACYGICPIFKLRLFEDGQVEFVGKQFVVATGPRYGRISRTMVDKLRTKIAEANLEKLAPDCCNCRNVTDHPWTRLALTDEKGTISVDHYHGCYSAPKMLSDLEKEIILTAGAQKWIGSESKRRQFEDQWWKESRR
jgi:Domain of unknown function (DUF6438)